jgi:periplasmic protein TonB
MGSVLLHVAALAVLLRAVVLPAGPHAIPIRIALVGRSGGGGGSAGPPAEAAPAPLAPAPLPPQPAAEPSRPARRAVAHAPARAPAAPRPTAAPPAEDSGVADRGGGGAGGTGNGNGDGTGGGDGSGGDGSGGARVAYGANPLPPYPYVARRLRKEGVVLLEVLVAADGHAADVRVVRSSGFAPLDEAALTTVRDRWRFIPARRGGEAIESRVPVPIRFRIEDAQS